MNVICYAVAIILAAVLWFLWELRAIEQIGRQIDDERDLP